jgi:hypothetical protein
MLIKILLNYVRKFEKLIYEIRSNIYAQKFLLRSQFKIQIFDK